MADFCNVCHPKVWGETNNKGKKLKPDIDVMEQFKKLKEGYFVPVLCEGCTMNGIMNDKGKVKVHFLSDPPDVWHDYDEDLILERFDKESK